MSLTFLVHQVSNSRDEHPWNLKLDGSGTCFDDLVYIAVGRALLDLAFGFKEQDWPAPPSTTRDDLGDESASLY